MVLVNDDVVHSSPAATVEDSSTGVQVYQVLQHAFLDSQPVDTVHEALKRGFVTGAELPAEKGVVTDPGPDPKNVVFGRGATGALYHADTAEGAAACNPAFVLLGARLGRLDVPQGLNCGAPGCLEVWRSAK